MSTPTQTKQVHGLTTIIDKLARNMRVDDGKTLPLEDKEAVANQLEKQGLTWVLRLMFVLLTMSITPESRQPHPSTYTHKSNTQEPLHRPAPHHHPALRLRPLQGAPRPHHGLPGCVKTFLCMNTFEPAMQHPLTPSLHTHPTHTPPHSGDVWQQEEAQAAQLRVRRAVPERTVPGGARAAAGVGGGERAAAVAHMQRARRRGPL